MCQVLGHQALLVLVLEAVYKHACNSRTIGLSSTDDKLHNLIYNHDPIIVILSSNSEEYVNVCMGLVEG